MNIVRKLIAAVEPWYDWGPWGWERLDSRGEGQGRYFELEWFGLKLVVAIGRRPPVTKDHAAGA